MLRPYRAQCFTLACRLLFLVEDVDGLCIIPQLIEIHPVIRAERFFLGPNFVKRVGVIQRTGLHDHRDVSRVMDVIERIRVENHQIGKLAYFERTEIFISSKKMRAMQAGHLQTRPSGR